MDKYGGMSDVYAQMTELNELIYLINNQILTINTAIPVKVVAVYSPVGSSNPTGYVDVVPLVSFTDSNGEMIEPTTLFHVPYFRLQGGVVAIVADPIVGDIGLTIFAQKDSTNVVVGTKETVLPASFRTHSMSDGWYIGGFLNQKPTCYLELNQDNSATLNANGGVVINASSGMTINASGSLTINGDTKINGKLTVSDDCVAGGISVDNHTHEGVHGETQPPSR